MKILFFHRWVGVHLGGTETHIRDLMEQFLKKGHEVAVLTRSGPELSDHPSRIKIHRVGKNWGESDHSYEDIFRLYFHTGLFIIKSFFHLLYLIFIGNERFDVISVHFVTEAKVARLVRFLFKIPYVFVLEGYTHLEAEEAKLANQAIAISGHEVDETFKNHGYKPLYLPKGKNEIFNLDVDGCEIRERYLDDFEKLIIAVGRVESRKDYPTLVKVAQILKNEGKRYRFLIVGDGIDFQKIKNLIKDAGLENEVIMLGPLANSKLPAYYRACDLFFLPTLYEGFGYVFVEAMACGLPVVSTTAGAVPEVVGRAGILESPKDATSMARAIEKILTDGKFYETLKTKAKEISDFYDWNRLIVEYEKVYQSVTQRYIKDNPFTKDGPLAKI